MKWRIWPIRNLCRLLGKIRKSLRSHILRKFIKNFNKEDFRLFNNKTLLITGGTGSFGKAVLNRFLSSDIKEIRIFSRDEKKQDDLRKKYNNPKIKFFLG